MVEAKIQIAEYHSYPAPRNHPLLLLKKHRKRRRRDEELMMTLDEVVNIHTKYDERMVNR